MSYTPKNNFNLRLVKTGDTVPIYTPENNSNLQLKRVGVGEIGFRKKLLADVACCDALDYDFRFDFNPDQVPAGGGIVINIIGGCSDFTWEITGSDFTLDDATTSVRYNIVRAGVGTTVGTTGILTVTDSCNTIIETTIVCCGISVCTWSFKLYRDDDTTERDGGGNITTPSGTLLNLTGLLILSIFDSSGNGVGGIPGYDPDYPEYWTFVEVENIWYYDDSEDYPDDPWRGSYNINTGYWKVDMHREALPNEKFWAYYNTAEYGLSQSRLDYKGIQYPYRYKAADRGNTSDMIPVGIYEANVPYWNNYYDEHYGDGHGHYIWNPTPIELTCQYPDELECSDYAGFSLCVSGTPWAYWKDQFSFTNKLKTSIPYWTRYQIARATNTMVPYGYRTLPSSDCGVLNETGTPLNDLVTFISTDSLFNKILSSMVIWPVGYNVAHSEWQERPVSILTENINTLTVTNNKPHDEYLWSTQRDLVYISWTYWNWSQIIFNWDEYEESEYDFF